MTETPSPAGSRKVRQSHLLNRSEVRKFILDTIQRARPHLRIHRVSREAIEALEAWLREKIRSEVHSHPSVGKTFRP